MNGGGADWAGQQADRIIAVNQRESARRRRLRQRPYGLAAGSRQPGPARISSEAVAESPRAVLAFVTRSPVPRSKIVLAYGAAKIRQLLSSR